MHKIALTVILNGPFFFNLGAIPFLFPPHPHPNPSGCARVSVTQSHCLITAEGQRNINDFLTRISSSKQDLNGCWKKFWSLRITKKYLTPCTRQLMGRKAIFSADGCPDGLWRIQLSLTAAVYYSDFAQQIIENAAVSNWNYKLIYFEISSSRYFTR